MNEKRSEQPLPIYLMKFLFRSMTLWLGILSLFKFLSWEFYRRKRWAEGKYIVVTVNSWLKVFCGFQPYNSIYFAFSMVYFSFAFFFSFYAWCFFCHSFSVSQCLTLQKLKIKSKFGALRTTIDSYKIHFENSSKKICTKLQC